MRCEICRTDTTAIESRYCCQKHLDLHRKEISGERFRSDVEKRDHGVCAKCNADTRKLRRVIEALVEIATPVFNGGQYVPNKRALGARVRLYKIYSNPRYRWAFASVGPAVWQYRLKDHLWEADHIRARVNGGTNSIRNAQTLCRRCHPGKTKDDVRVHKEWRLGD